MLALLGEIGAAFGFLGAVFALSERRAVVGFVPEGVVFLLREFLLLPDGGLGVEMIARILGLAMLDEFEGAAELGGVGGTGLDEAVFGGRRFDAERDLFALG